MNDGKMIQILYNYWMEGHIDSDRIKANWKKAAKDLSEEEKNAFNVYAESLEEQAFSNGFSCGVTLMFECLAQHCLNFTESP